MLPAKQKQHASPVPVIRFVRRRLRRCPHLLSRAAGAILIAALAACGGHGNDAPPASPNAPAGSNTTRDTIGGTVSGLLGSGLVLQDNAGDDLPISANGGFAFATSVASGATYAVTVKAEPVSPSQTCTVNNGSGTAGDANVGNVAVICSTDSYSVGGTVSGLLGSGLVLQDNAADNLAISANGSFTFATPVASGASFAVTVQTQPRLPTQTCTVSSGNGPVGAGNVASVAVQCVTPAPRFAYVANWSNGTVSGYTVNAATGNLTAIAGSPFATGAGTIAGAVVDPRGRFAVAATGGAGADTIVAYTVDATTGALTKAAGSPIPAEPGLTAIAVAPNGAFFYVSSSTVNSVSAYSINATTGALAQVFGSPFAAGSEPHGVAVDPGGKFVYVANYGDSTVSAYSVDAVTGVLTQVAGSPFSTGPSPSAVTVDPSGQFVYVTNSGGDDVSAYAINSATGALTQVPGSPFATGPLPSAVTVDPGGKFVYVANESSNNVSAYTLNATTGVLTAVAGSPFAAGASPSAITAEPSDQFVYVGNRSGNTVSVFTIDSVSGTLALVGTVVSTSPASIAVGGQ
jgi:6-phosphogluconolactonase